MTLTISEPTDTLTLHCLVCRPLHSALPSLAHTQVSGRGCLPRLSGPQDNPPVLILFGRTLSLAVAAPHTACLCGQDIKIETAELAGVASSAISYDEKLQTATIRAPPACPAAASRSCAWGACMRGGEKGSICAAAAAAVAAAAARAPPLPPAIHLSSCVRCPRFRRDGARRRHHPLAHLRGGAQRQDVRLLPLHIHRPPPPSQPSPALPPPLLSASTCLAPALETERVAEFVSELRSFGCRWVARAR